MLTYDPATYGIFEVRLLNVCKKIFKEKSKQTGCGKGDSIAKNPTLHFDTSEDFIKNILYRYYKAYKSVLPISVLQDFLPTLRILYINSEFKLVA